MSELWTLRGRKITDQDIALIERITAANFNRGRKHISREVCHAWKWYQASGATKDRAVRDILLFLEQKNLIKLPSRKKSSNNQSRSIQPLTLQEFPLSGILHQHPSVTLKLLETRKEYALFNGIVARYHYQGSKVIVGKSLRYMAFIDQRPVACLGWGSAAWSMECRDQWIGWSKAVKDRHLHRIANNIRFLILPWIRIKYLASHLLSLSARRVPMDWQRQFGSSIYLLETFVEEERFKGTCYQAANWTHLGRTKGSAKRGNFHHAHGNIKKVYVYPLAPNFRDRLTENENEEEK